MRKRFFCDAGEAWKRSEASPYLCAHFSHALSLYTKQHETKRARERYRDVSERDHAQQTRASRMPSKAPLGDGEEEEEEEFREISFGYTGGVFYPFERAPFREEEEEEESIFPRAKRPLLSSVSSSRDEGGGFKRIETDGRPIVASVARCPESELVDIERARAKRLIRAQNVSVVKETTNRVNKVTAERDREVNLYRHAICGVPFQCLNAIALVEKEEEQRRARTRRDEAANCLKIFRDGTVVTRDAKGRAVRCYEGVREVIERRNEYQRTFDVQGIEEEEGRGEMKMVASRDFCGVSVSKTNKSGTFRCEFSTPVMNDNDALPTDMRFTNQSACGEFSDCCLRVATEVGTVKTYRPGESSWVKWDTVSLGLENADGVVRQWHGCYEATHPRTMLYCDSNRIQFVDERRPEVLNTRVGGISATIFTSRDERIQCASNVLPGTFLFAVGTRKSVKLYDIRKYSPVDPVFSWKHGMHSSPSSVEVRNDFRRAFDTTRINNNNNNYISILAVSHKTGDAMAFETKGVNNTCSESFTMSALSAGIRLVPQSTDAPWGGFQFYPGETREKAVLPFFAWSEEATGTVYVQNFEDVKTKATEEAAITDCVENSMPLSFGHSRRKIRESFDAHSYGKLKRREPFDISRQLDDEGELLPHIYNGSSKYVAIDAAWKREEEMIAENRNYVEEPEDAAAAAAAAAAFVELGTQMMCKAAAAFDLAKRIKVDDDLRELRKHGKTKMNTDDGLYEARGRGHKFQLNPETGENEMIFGGHMCTCPIIGDDGKQCEFTCWRKNRFEAMKTHLWERHKIKSRLFKELVETGEARKEKNVSGIGRQKTINAPMSYNFLSIVGEEGNSADYPKHVQSKRDERDEYWEAIGKRAKENLEDQNDLRQTVHQIKSIEMEQYQSIDSADVMKRLRNLRENGWGTILVIDDEDKYEDDEEKERIDLLIGNLENRRPRTGTIQKTKRKGFSRLPLSPGAISPPKRNKKKETLEKEKPPSVDVMVKKKNVFPSAALPVNAQPSPLPAARPPKSAEEKKNTNRKKEKKRGKRPKEKNKKKKVAGFL